jgi:NitT/TauT family transport system ATP-binding protein
MSAACHVQHVTQAFGIGPAALADVSLQIAAGEFVALVGPSGCGKSTLLRLLAGLLKPTQGAVAVEGSDRAAPRRAFVFQEPTLLPWRTVLENIALPMEVGAAPADAATRLQQTLTLVGLLPEDGRKFPRQLSGGMQMRVSLARAIITQPELLLLDEPFAALDDLLRQQLNEELLRWWQAQGWTAVFVTHNVAEAVFLSQRVLVMSPRPGRIVADIRIDQPYPRPPEWRADPAFAALVGQISDRLRQEVAA